MRFVRVLHGADLLGQTSKQMGTDLKITLAFHAHRVYYRENFVESFYYM
ncbi:MAG: hypothetical protein LBQ77_01985 [Treponema sp.]|nr:hypothetical protein [Treponema sp.]